MNRILSLLGGLIFMGFLISNINAQLLDPDKHYDSYPIQVNKYNIEEVIEKAIENNYTIRYSIGCLGPPVSECTKMGLIKEWYFNDTNSDPNKRFGVVTTFVFPNETTSYNVTHIGLGKYTKDFEFSASPQNNLKNIYIWRIGIASKSGNITLEQAEEQIVDELKELGIIEDDIDIQFYPGYYPPELAAGSSDSLYFSNIIYLVILIVVVTVIVLVFHKKVGGEKNE